MPSSGLVRSGTICCWMSGGIKLVLCLDFDCCDHLRFLNVVARHTATDFIYP